MVSPNISDQLTQEQFKEIVLHVFHRILDAEQVEVQEVVYEIKRLLMAGTGELAASKELVGEEEVGVWKEQPSPVSCTIAGSDGGRSPAKS